jgi:D-alanine-D-alanine ligase
MTGLRVWVLCGGPSGEAEVSRTSARGVVRALQTAGHDARQIEFVPTVAEQLLRERPDAVFPVTHGALGEDGCLQGLLEVFDIPYVGSGVLGSALGANKPYAKALWRLAGLPVAPEYVVRRGDELSAAAAECRSRLGRAVVVKPASGGSAIGVVRVSADTPEAELSEVLGRTLAFDSEVLVETWLTGKEVTCGVLELDGKLRALPPTLILPERADFYDFTSKYAPGGSRHICPAPLSEAHVERIQALAVRAHQVIGARDLSRIDFVVDDRRSAEYALNILELNSLPGMTSTSLYPEAAGIAGISFDALVDGLVRQAVARPRRAAPVVLAMPT